MWHARVIRPPYTGRDGGDFIGNSLISVDETSIAHIAQNIKVIVKGDFVAVAAEREEHAIKAMRCLKVQWKSVPKLQPLNNLEEALRNQEYSPRTLLEQDEAEPQAQAQAGISLKRSYLWPYHMHASVGPSCAVAQCTNETLTVWGGTQNPHMLRVELAQLVQLSEGNVNIVRYEASGCYGRNCADDVCADAALISKEIGRPVRVQLTREQEHGWEPKGAAQLIDIEGSLDNHGRLLSYNFITRYPSNDAPSLALILTGVRSNQPRTLQMGDRTSVPPYVYPRMKIASHDMAPIVRAAWLRGVSAMPNSFAHDSFIDELAYAANADPVDFRLQYLRESNARDVLAATARKANWQAGVKGSRGVPDEHGVLRGRGVAYARYVHSKFPGFGAAWSAWVVDVAVDATTGRVTVDRVVVGQDTGMMVNPDGVRHQIHGNVIQSLSRVLKEEVKFNGQGVVDHEWGAYPIISFTEIPPIEVVLMDRQDDPPMGAGESSSVPSGAAIANALFDATGVRYREVPFTPARILAGLAAAGQQKTLAETASA
ncbi:MAG: aldehyde dehydrogenase [Pusillimonas sp.]|nr:aldehyde dehydrogenase [Pusillimonas sp.]